LGAVRDARVFNGCADRLPAPTNVLATGNAIKTICSAVGDTCTGGRAHGDDGADRRSRVHSGFDWLPSDLETMRSNDG